jgi:hypothetical protein
VRKPGRFWVGGLPGAVAGEPRTEERFSNFVVTANAQSLPCSFRRNRSRCCANHKPLQPPAKSYSGFKHVRWRVLRIDAKLLGMAQRAAEAEGHMLCSEARFLRDFRLP